ncbi:hypothetical protein FRB90_000442 [Tulasnella sp. 427]|nr:hypothetical protein FRB90_000442 [Tulasnella sp. 427]
MPAKKKERVPCKECINRGRPCEGLYPECDYYRRSVPTKAALAAEEASGTKPHRYFLEQHLRKLEEKYERLSEEASSLSSLSVPSRAISSSPSPAADIPGPPFYPRPAEMTGRWWEAELLAPPIRDYLTGITLAFANQDDIYFHHELFRNSLNLHPSLDEAPHRSLLEAMYLVACYYTSVKFPNPTSPYSLVRLEDYFLARARKAQNDSLAYAKRLVDTLKGACLMTGYLIKRGRFLEASHSQACAMGLAFSCGLHEIVSPFFNQNALPLPPPVTTTQEQRFYLLAPSSQIELAERIMCFWSVYIRDKATSIINGVPAVLNEGQEGISTILPRPAVEYETNDLRPGDIETLTDLFSARPPNPAKRPDSHFTSHIKGIALYERARAMMRLSFEAPGRVNQHDLMALQHAIKTFLGTLPPVRDALEDGPPFWSPIIAAHTYGLGALLELKSNVSQREQVDAAKRMSRLVPALPNLDGLRGYCVYGHCWPAGNEIAETDRCMSRLMVGSKRLTAVYPSFGVQLNHVQQLIEMTSITD